MNAIRQFVEVRDHSFSISLPQNFNAKNVEVIILPSEEHFVSDQTKNMLDERLKAYQSNPNEATDFDSFLDELESEL